MLSLFVHQEDNRFLKKFSMSDVSVNPKSILSESYLIILDTWFVTLNL